MKQKSDTPFTSCKRFAIGAMFALTLTGCVTSPTVSPPGVSEGIGYRAQRFAEISAIRAWRVCRDEAMELDNLARSSGGAARYLASAKLFEKCESEVGPDAARVASEERAHAYALAVLNYLRGGNIVKAQEALSRFKTTFGGQDLYFADGSSFTETMELLVGLGDGKRAVIFATYNAPKALKAELRRVNHWKRN